MWPFPLFKCYGELRILRYVPALKPFFPSVFSYTGGYCRATLLVGLAITGILGGPNRTSGISLFPGTDLRNY